MSWIIAVATGGYTSQPVVDVLAAVHEAGISSVELGTPPRHFAPWDHIQIDAVEDALKRTGITPRSLHAPFGGILDLADFNPHHRQAAVAAILTAAGALARLGGQIVVVHPSDIPRRQDEVHGRLSCCIEALGELAGALERMELHLAVESPLPHLIGGHPEEFTRIVDALPARVGVCLDTGHTHLGRHWSRFMELVGDRVTHIHATDTRGQYDDHLPPGDGVIDWHQIRQSLEHVGYGGIIVLEVNGAPGPIAPYLRRAMSQAERLFSAETVNRPVDPEDTRG